MATEKEMTKEELLEAFNKNGIHTLEDLVDAMMPETGGYRILFSDNLASPPLLTIPHTSKGAIGLKMNWYDIQVDEGFLLT